jgi:hypothetical protein
MERFAAKGLLALPAVRDCVIDAYHQLGAFQTTRSMKNDCFRSFSIIKITLHEKIQWFGDSKAANLSAFCSSSYVRIWSADGRLKRNV